MIHFTPVHFYSRFRLFPYDVHHVSYAYTVQAVLSASFVLSFFAKRKYIEAMRYRNREAMHGALKLIHAASFYVAIPQ